MTSRQSIKQKMLLVSSSTLLSRILGVVRELLWSRYLGAGMLSDAFFTAFKIPNSLRKVFAEGALSAAFIPTIVQTVRAKGHTAVSELMSIAFLIFEGAVLIACAFAMYHAQTVIYYIAGGFSTQQIAMATPWLQILMPFIFFISSSALLAGALQSVNHFFVPAFSPALLNIITIGGTLCCIHFQLPITYLCWAILAAGALQLMWHIITYLKLQFSFAPITRYGLKQFQPTLIKFALCLPATGAEELNLFISTSFASYLTSGSISLISYASRFAQLPQGVFGTALSTILLPQFSKISTYAPQRLSFYLLESAKLIIWLMLPVTMLMCFFAPHIFISIFLSDKFTLSQAYEAGFLLQIYLSCLIFTSLNKLMRVIFYSQHNTWVPTLIAIASVFINYTANTYFITYWKAPGLAFASLCSTIVQTVLFIVLLKKQYKLTFYCRPFCSFLICYAAQLAAILTPFYGIYSLCTYLIQHTRYASMLLNTVALWVWAGPLCLLFAFSLFASRRYFNIRLYFID